MKILAGRSEVNRAGMDGRWEGKEREGGQVREVEPGI